MIVLPLDPMMSYAILVGTGGNKKIRKGISIVWLAYVWVLWRVRNDRVFNNSNLMLMKRLIKFSVSRDNGISTRRRRVLVFCMNGFGIREIA